MRSIILVSTLLISSIFAQAQILKHGDAPDELKRLQSRSGYGEPRFYSQQEVPWTPVFESADYKYVLMSTEASFSEAENLRYKIAQNLPAGVKLVLLVGNNQVESYKKIYSKYISLDRVIMAAASSISGGFWARDAFPYPVTEANGKLALVAAQYYRPFSAGASLAQALELNLTQNDFTFVGGNLLADQVGRCFSVNSRRLYDVTESDLLNAYGCKSVHFLKHLSGIGDVDEVLKPLPNKMMLTNNVAYKAELEALGYTVVMLPSIPNSYRTYVNALVVGKTMFMPTYGVSTDQQAKKVYEDLGYTVVGITSNTLSDQYNGSVHCQTMAYPAMSEDELMKLLQLQRVD